jgi:hypothetical protein
VTPTIQISVSANGETRLQTNIDNPVAFFGMLEMAKDMYRQSLANQANGSGIVAATKEALSQLATAGK